MMRIANASSRNLWLQDELFCLAISFLLVQVSELFSESTMNSCWVRHEKLIWETLGCNWFNWFNLDIQWISMVFSSILCSWNSAKLWPHQLKSVIFQSLRVRASKSLPIISDSMCCYMIWNDDQSIRQPMTYNLHQSTIFELISSCSIIYIKHYKAMSYEHPSIPGVLMWLCLKK